MDSFRVKRKACLTVPNDHSNYAAQQMCTRALCSYVLPELERNCRYIPSGFFEVATLVLEIAEPDYCTDKAARTRPTDYLVVVT